MIRNRGEIAGESCQHFLIGKGGKNGNDHRKYRNSDNDRNRIDRISVSVCPENRDSDDFPEKISKNSYDAPIGNRAQPFAGRSGCHGFLFGSGYPSPDRCGAAPLNIDLKEKLCKNSSDMKSNTK